MPVGNIVLVTVLGALWLPALWFPVRLIDGPAARGRVFLAVAACVEAMALSVMVRADVCWSRCVVPGTVMEVTGAPLYMLGAAITGHFFVALAILSAVVVAVGLLAFRHRGALVIAVGVAAGGRWFRRSSLCNSGSRSERSSPRRNAWR